MNLNSPMLLIGVGNAGAKIARRVNRAFGGELRFLTTDTDATTDDAKENFVLLGGDRLSGRGTGGDIVSARLATEDSISAFSDQLEGVRLAVIATGLGGGTGGGATLEIIKHLQDLGIPTIVFATTPFNFEGPERQHNAQGIIPLIESAASASFVIPLDKLVNNIDNMDSAMLHAIDTMATGITLFWRIVECPGYIRMDVDRLRHLIMHAGKGRFASISAQGINRTSEIIDGLLRSELLGVSPEPVKSVLCGILAGEDLRLSEVGQISENVRTAFGNNASFDLATVNDEQTFTGRICVVVMLFEKGAEANAPTPNGDKLTTRRKTKSVLGTAPSGRGRFNNSMPTIWNGEDIDTPTFIRRNIDLNV